MRLNQLFISILVQGQVVAIVTLSLLSPSFCTQTAQYLSLPLRVLAESSIDMYTNYMSLLLYVLHHLALSLTNRKGTCLFWTRKVCNV